MNLPVLVPLLAFAGALLFFAAGFLLASARAAAAIEDAQAPAAHPVDPPPELEHLRAQLAAGASDKAALSAQLTQLTAELEAERLTNSEAAKRLGAQASAAEAAAQSLTAAEHEIASLTEKLKAQSSDTGSRLEAKSAELAAAVAALSQAKAQLVLREADADIQKRDAARLRTELERACDEIASMRVERLHANKAIAAREAVEHELQRLKALQFAAQAASSKPLRSVQLAAAARASAESLTELVKRVHVQGQYESVAIADELGLTAAGFGPHADELSAFTSLLLGVSARASRFFPMHDFGYASLSDANGVCIEARPVSGTHGFVLMTLGATHNQDTQ